MIVENLHKEAKSRLKLLAYSHIVEFLKNLFYPLFSFNRLINSVIIIELYSIFMYFGLIFSDYTFETDKLYC